MHDNRVVCGDPLRYVQRVLAQRMTAGWRAQPKAGTAARLIEAGRCVSAVPRRAQSLLAHASRADAAMATAAWRLRTGFVRTPSTWRYMLREEERSGLPLDYDADGTMRCPLCCLPSSPPDLLHGVLACGATRRRRRHLAATVGRFLRPWGLSGWTEHPRPAACPSYDRSRS